MIGLAATAALVSLPAQSADLTVNIAGIDIPKGQICCELYVPDKKFLEPSAAIGWKWVDAHDGGVQCRFDNIAGGSYAVAVTTRRHTPRRGGARARSAAFERLALLLRPWRMSC